MAITPTSNDRLCLPNSTTNIPRIGFGSYKIRGEACTTAVLAALSAGYRHIDSAILYRNEEQIYDAIEQSGLAREEIIITTKVGNRKRAKGQDEVYRDVLQSVDRIAGVDGYVDLLLIHVPGPSLEHRKGLWCAMERIKREGRAKSIGLHPWCQQRDVVTYCQANGIVVEAYSPLATGTRLDNPTIQRIATKHNKTPAQILISYSLQKGWVPLPKSSDPDRIRENIDVFEFALDQDDVDSLNALDEGSAGAVFRKNVD
ncbi:hypothetical protein F66182_1842 [Fusarium sp. NRRL 66182]|nr:hypothetical protein F66182_1842 [Fusarium sp. NRRL 66182]